MRRVLLTAYALCGCAGIEVELVPETADLAPYDLILAPATQKLLAPTWLALEHLAQEGRCVYWSYYGGDQGFLWGAWCYGFENLTGARHGQRFGIPEVPPPVVTLNGSDFSIQVSTAGGGCGVEGAFSRAFLPLKDVQGEVLARDSKGEPALIEKIHGQGRFIFLNHPLEYYLGETASALVSSGAINLYKYLAKKANIIPSVTCDDPLVQIREVSRDGGNLLWIFNHAWESRRVTVTLDRDAHPFHGVPSNLKLEEGPAQLDLNPKQVMVFHLVPSLLDH